ncbi:MAG TPA: type II CAAX endopeptidase family protein [Chthoniobacterales bacterium]
MFNGLINALLVIAALYVYLSLFRQIEARHNGAASLGERRLGIPEAVAASLLIAWFILNLIAASRIENTVFHTRDLLLTGGFSLATVAILTALLQLRGFSVVSLGGFSRLGFGRIVSTAAVLLFAAYPLLFAADSISRWVLGEGVRRQQIVEMFTNSQTLGQRVLIIVLAITIAPFAEEFIFRFFLYGVLKRYFGRGIGLIFNALLFGAVHVHLPSLGPLFVLGGCFTLAYEWSGSILVSMTMHALFNFFSLSALAFPDLLPQ